MAYKTADLEKKAIDAIKKHGLIYIEEVVSYLPCDKRTFYRHECHECPAIKDAIEANKINTKAKLRRKWKDSDNATLNIALYKLCATDKELEKLTVSNTKTEVKKVDGDEGKTIKELEKELEELGLARTDKEGETAN